MPTDPFKNILHEAVLRNKYEFNYIKNLKLQIYMMTTKKINTLINKR